MTELVSKPWGGEEIFARTDRYVGKILTIRAGHALSLQYHERKEETMRVLGGRVELHLGRSPGDASLDVRVMGPGDAVHIVPGVRHRLIALDDVEIVEVSTPELDDVVRLDDRYGREGTNRP